MPSPPKPWEGIQSTAAIAAAPSSTQSAADTTSSATQPSTAVSSAPQLPSRSSLTQATSGYSGSSYSPYQSRFGSPYGTPFAAGYGGSYGGYGGYGGYGAFSSPYSRLGTGYGGYLGYGAPGPEDQSLSRRLEHGTAATFQMIESIVGAFGGFAQMLESTFMATHSSFFAMVSVAEQFGNIKNSLGSILGIFALLRWSRLIIAKITGRVPPVEITPEGFAKFESRTNSRPTPSKKPFLFFLAAVIGLPYLMSRLIQSLSQVAEEEKNRAGMEPVDPSKLEFCRALYDFAPQDPDVELGLRQGDIIAILSKTDPAGRPCQWWRGRLRNGATGYFPSNYVDIIPRQVTTKKITDAGQLSVEEFEKS